MLKTVVETARKLNRSSATRKRRTAMMKKLLLAAIAMGLVTGTASLHAATIPLSEDFDDDSGTPSQQGESWALYESLGTGVTSTWSLQSDGSGQDYEVEYSATAEGSFEQGRVSRYLTYSNPEKVDSFSTEFTLDSLTGDPDGDFAIAGLALFADFGTGDAGYQVDFFIEDTDANQREGQVRITNLETGGTLSGSTLTIATDTIYTMIVDVSYSGSTLNLSAEVSDGTDIITTNGSDSTPLTGDDFGLWSRLGSNSSNTSSMNLDFDNVSLTAIPEPASLVLLLLGSMAVLGRRRTRR